MKADALISRLEKVRVTGRGQWIACCPAHDDSSPSMKVTELDDGRVLVHCFAECSVEAILTAVGLTFDALFPEKAIADRVKPLRRPFPAADVLECLAFESALVAMAASTLASGNALNATDLSRMKLAQQRIEAGRRLALG